MTAWKLLLIIYKATYRLVVLHDQEEKQTENQPENTAIVAVPQGFEENAQHVRLQHQ